VSGPAGPNRGRSGLAPLVFAGTSDRSQEAPAMTNPDRSRHIEVGDGEQPDAAAEITTSAGAAGTVRASLHAQAGHITPGSRASLVDAVMDLPEVQASTRLEATIPRGDGESLERLRERTEDAVTRQAGSTTLLDANIPSDSQPGPGQDPDGGTTSLPPLPRAVLIRASSCHRPGRPSPGAWALWPTGRALPSAATGPRNSGDGHKAAQPTEPLHHDEPRGDAVERRPRPTRSTAAPSGQMGWTCSAWGPLAPWPAVNSTRWSSWRLR
jgi:hypothetical protein